MRRDNKLVKFTAFVLLITLIAICLVSGTYAKYTTSITLSDTATVAKWSIKMNGKTEETATFDLFSTITDIGGTDADTNVTGAKTIAPGTAGEFSLEIVNDSDVSAVYSIDFTVNGPTDLPLQFKVGETGSWSSDLEDIAQTELAKGTKTINVQWQWAFEEGADDTAKAERDAEDTAFGKLAEDARKVTVSAKLTATQVD